MNIKIFRFSKYADSLSALETRINTFIESVGDLSGLHVQESVYNGDILFSVEYYGSKKSVNQIILISPLVEASALEGVVNNALSGVAEQGLKARFLNFVYTAKSPRCLAAFIVEGNPPQKSTPDHEPNEKRQSQDSSQPTPENPEQDPKPNARPNKRGKRKTVT